MGMLHLQKHLLCKYLWSRRFNFMHCQEWEKNLTHVTLTEPGADISLTVFSELGLLR